MNQRHPPRVTVVIPLYRSRPFIDTIIANIDAMPQSGIEIIISDRHCHDDAIDRLAQHYAEDHRVRCIQQRDGLGWVGHINTLLELAGGEYWRLLPHDDISPPGSLEALIAALDAAPDAVLAYGPTKAVDSEGRHLLERDAPSPHPQQAEEGWTLGLVLQMFWMGYCSGAFKGLIRRRVVMENQLFIRSTEGQIFPEGCWLFALGLLGPFCFVPEAVYIKRYHAASVHAQWQITGRNFSSAAQVMISYLRDLVGPRSARQYGMLDMRFNGTRVSLWQDKRQHLPRPGYKPITRGWLWLFSLQRLSILQAITLSHRSRIDGIRKLPLPLRETERS